MDVRRVPFEKLVTLDGGELSGVIRARVEAACEIQATRFTTLDKEGILANGDMRPAEVQEFCSIDASVVNLVYAMVRMIAYLILTLTIFEAQFRLEVSPSLSEGLARFRD